MYGELALAESERFLSEFTTANKKGMTMSKRLGEMRLGDLYQVKQEICDWITLQGCFAWGGCASVRWEAEDKFVVYYSICDDDECVYTKRAFKTVHEAVGFYLMQIGGQATITFQVDEDLRKRLGFVDPYAKMIPVDEVFSIEVKVQMTSSVRHY